MKREILFRGKCKRTGKWLYGDLVQWKSQGRCAITPQEGDKWDSPSDFEVDPETVGQYAGNLDAKGNKVFEGDIVFSEQWNPAKYKITFNEGEFSFIDLNKELYYMPIHYVKNFEITSNIHDQ